MQSPDQLSTPQSPGFVHWFRQVAPYVHAFRGRTFVIAFGGEVVRDGRLTSLTHDFNLLASLGVKLILVHGARPQIDAQIQAQCLTPRYHKGIRITDSDTMEAVISAVGKIRVAIEASLSMGLANSPMANAGIRVSSGNFVTAQPMGIVDGIDYCYSGTVRKVDTAALKNRLMHNETILLSPLGYSPTGEVFNLTMAEVASSVAIATQADKLIFLLEEQGIFDARNALIRAMTAAQAEHYLQTLQTSEEIQHYLPKAITALRKGVSRVQLISSHIDGALLTELFSHEGIGTMISHDPLETLRQATIDDVGGLLQLISPLEEDGVLVKRGREQLEREINRYSILEHDGKTIGCVALYTFSHSPLAELACLVIHPDYRDAERGQILLTHIEQQARSLGVKQLFVLTTRTAHWFLEHGFVQASVDDLPVQKKELYNLQRRSKVFIKPI